MTPSKTCIASADDVVPGDVISRDDMNGNEMLETVTAVEIIGAGRMRKFTLECDGHTYDYVARNRTYVRILKSPTDADFPSRYRPLREMTI